MYTIKTQACDSESQYLGMSSGIAALDWSAIIIAFVTGLFVLCKHIKHSRCRSACMRASMDTTSPRHSSSTSSGAGVQLSRQVESDQARPAGLTLPILPSENTV